jgi:hypothetical protein
MYLQCWVDGASVEHHELNSENDSLFLGEKKFADNWDQDFVLSN